MHTAPCQLHENGGSDGADEAVGQGAAQGDPPAMEARGTREGARTAVGGAGITPCTRFGWT